MSPRIPGAQVPPGAAGPVYRVAATRGRLALRHV